MARVKTSESVSRAGRPVFGGSKERLSFHHSSICTYNETKKESRSMAAPSFGEFGAAYGLGSFSVGLSYTSAVLELRVCEVRILGILRSSPTSHSRKLLTLLLPG